MKKKIDKSVKTRKKTIKPAKKRVATVKVIKKKIDKIDDKIKQTLETIRPSLQSDGGDIEFVAFNKKTGIVTVSLTGMCTSCPMSQITLKEGVEALVRKENPEVKSVINV